MSEVESTPVAPATAPWEPPTNETAEWVFTPNPDASDNDAEIARMYWSHTRDGNGFHFNHTMAALEEMLGISANDIRRIQKSAGVLQPPYRTGCTNVGCDRYLLWINFSSRTKLEQFSPTYYQCHSCREKAQAVRNETANQRQSVEERARTRKAQLRARYGDRIVGDCPQCSGVKVLRKASNGGVFIGCSEFPNCDYRSALPQPVELSELTAGEVAEARQLLASAPKCPNCGAAMAHRTGKFGEFLGCTNYPKCRGAVPLPVVQPEAVEEPEEIEDEPVLDFVRRIRIALEKPEVAFDLETKDGRRVYEVVHEAWERLKATEYHLDAANTKSADGFRLAHVWAEFTADFDSIMAEHQAKKAAGEKVASELTGLATAGGTQS